MVDLVAKSPCDGLLPVSHGAAMLDEVLPEAITSVALLGGSDADATKALADALGLGFPAANRFEGSDGVKIVSIGPGKAFVLGRPVAIDGAACTDQSDAWAVMALEGGDARAVLARLCPADLRDGEFDVGNAAQTLLGHMTCTILRTGAERYEILVFRSMAQTAVHEMERAMRSVAALG